jgi:hypothetical protein
VRTYVSSEIESITPKIEDQRARHRCPDCHGQGRSPALVRSRNAWIVFLAAPFNADAIGQPDLRGLTSPTIAASEQEFFQGPPSHIAPQPEHWPTPAQPTQFARIALPPPCRSGSTNTHAPDAAMTSSSPRMSNSSRTRLCSQARDQQTVSQRRVKLNWRNYPERGGMPPRGRGKLSHKINWPLMHAVCMR